LLSSRRLAAQGLKEKNPGTRQKLFADATEHFNIATNMDMEVSETWVAKGLLQLSKGEIENAESSFHNALSLDANNALAVLGKVRLLASVSVC
jgi:Tfp pilus assembly protein PilF